MADQEATTIIGIDISKAKFDVAVLTEGQTYRLTFANESSSFKKLAHWLEKRKLRTIHACMEATGRYGDELAYFLHEQGHSVSVVNPKRIQAYAESQLRRNKTDALDATLIADFCRTQRPPAWQPPPPEVRELQFLTRHVEALKEMRTQEQNRQQAGVQTPAVQASLQSHIAFLDAEIERLQQQINDHIDRHDHLKEDVELLDSIPGIGPDTAAILIAEIKSIDAYDSAAELAAHAGLTPMHRYSGSSVRRRPKLSKIGNARLRKALFFPAMTAMRHNPAVKALHDRLKEKGKPNMLILAAAMRKLIHIVYGVLKHRRPFDLAYAAIPAAART